MFFRKRLKKYDPEKEQTLRNEIDEIGGLEKGDGLAMVLSALLVFMPVVLLIFGIFVLFAYWFM